MSNADFLIIGAGIVGLSVARELKKRHPKARIVVLEKMPCQVSIQAEETAAYYIVAFTTLPNR